MSSKFPNRKFAQPAALALTACLALTLAACGGGGGSPGSTSTGPITGNPEAPVMPKAAMVVVDGSDKPVTTLAGGQTATLRVTVTDTRGALVANEIVKFTADPLLAFTPESGSALTDAKGVAVIQVKPASNTSAGAAAVTATVVVAGQTATATANLAIGASPLVVTSLSVVAPPPRLPAFSTVALSIPLTTGGQPATVSTGLTVTSLCTGDKLATIVLGSLSGGVQSATYTNNGCLRGTDVITASVGNSSQTTSLPVDAASIGTIQFVGSDLQGSSIVLKGSGGLGRQESALLTFRVLDQNNQGLAGVDVDFSASTQTGGLAVAPVKGTTDSTGRVTTTVSAGTIPTPVRVFAQASRNGKTISGLSDTVTVSTGLPIQKSMSISADKYNIEGMDYDGIVSNITVRLADQYGNPISDDTAVSFVTEGGAIGSALRGACVTKDGGCTVPLKSQQFKPVDGRVTLLAFVQGLEDFVDANGDGQYSCANPVDSAGRAVTAAAYRPLIDSCASGGEEKLSPGGQVSDVGDPFLDSNFDGVYNATAGDLPIPYKGTTYAAAGNGQWGLNFIRRSIEIIFSTSKFKLHRQVCLAGKPCRDYNSTDGAPENEFDVNVGSSCSPVAVKVRLSDLLNNPMPVGTVLSIADSDLVVVSTIAPATVENTTKAGGTIHDFTVKPDPMCAGGRFGLRVTTPLLNTNTVPFKLK